MFGVLSLITPLMQNLEGFIALRCLTGVFLGAALPGTVALTGEYAPRRRRSTYIMLMGMGLAVGVTLSSALTSVLLNAGGWRSVMFVCGILPLVVAACLCAWQPESVFFLARDPSNRERISVILKRFAPTALFPHDARFFVANAGSGNVLGLLERDRRIGTLAIWLSYFMSLLVGISAQSWLPTIFLDVGYDQRAALGLTAATFSSLFLSTFIGGPLMDRFGAFSVIALMFGLAAVTVGSIGAVLHLSAPIVLVAAFLGTFFNSCAQKGMMSLCVYFYPPMLRTSGYSWSAGIGRIGGVIGPVAAGYAMAAHWRPEWLFYAASAPLALAGLSIAYVNRRYKLGLASSGGVQRDVE